MVVGGGAWWCMVVGGGVWWCVVVRGGAWFRGRVSGDGDQVQGLVCSMQNMSNHYTITINKLIIQHCAYMF